MHQLLNLVVLALASHARGLPDPIICEDTLDGLAALRLRRRAVPAGVRDARGGGDGQRRRDGHPVLPARLRAPGRRVAVAVGGGPGLLPTLRRAEPGHAGERGLVHVLVRRGVRGSGREHGVRAFAGVRELAFTQPPEWQSWYQTQTVLPRTGQGVIAPTPSPVITALPSSTPAPITSSTGESPLTQETQSTTSPVDAESVLGTGTDGQRIVSSTATGAASRLRLGYLLQLLSVVGYLAMVILI
ncbi:hypothetical protein F5Y05DRAFT_425187 [Hypoxylon sp. FL0543]|nr:hypothetical protein F5Y05DRAFT_425187 [Hypoxylon sp. FL0543]